LDAGQLKGQRIGKDIEHRQLSFVLFVFLRMPFDSGYDQVAFPLSYDNMFDIAIDHSDYPGNGACLVFRASHSHCKRIVRIGQKPFFARAERFFIVGKRRGEKPDVVFSLNYGLIGKGEGKRP